MILLECDDRECSDSFEARPTIAGIWAFDRHPGYAPAYYFRGSAKADRGEHQAAIEDFDEAIRLSPEYAAAYDHRARTCTQLGNDAQAQRDLDRAVELGSDRASLEGAIKVIKEKR